MPWKHIGEWRCGSSHSNLTLETDKWSASQPTTLPREATSGTLRVGGWVGLRTGFDSLEKR